MAVFNMLMAGALDALLYPFREMPPLVGLSVVSLLTAAAMMLVFRKTSDQQRLADVKRKIAAALFEIRLFNDDLGAVFRAQAELLKHNATYLRLSLVPMLILLLPIGFLMAHLDAHYAYSGLTPGQAVMMKLELRPDAPLASDPSLEAPAQVRVLTPAVRFPAANEVVWKIEPEATGTYELSAQVGDQRITKTIDATNRVVRRSPARVEPGLIHEFMNPAEPPLPAGTPVKAISIPYPSRGIRVLGWDVNWILAFFVATTVFAVVLRKPMRVTL